MAKSSVLGFPRIGLHREMKKALESFWRGNTSQIELLETARKIRIDNWKTMSAMGVTEIPSNDFSLYDHVLDTAIMLGAIPLRYQPFFKNSELEGYFSMARGTDGKGQDAISALEMTKWFNTNYHYIVPEIDPDTEFKLNDTKIISEYKEARTLGLETRPIILGPVTFLMLSKSLNNSFNPISKLADLIPIYADLLKNLKEVGVEWVQIDEPFLVMDFSSQLEEHYNLTYKNLTTNENRPKIMLSAYFEAPYNIPAFCGLPTEGLHFDVVSSPSLIKSISVIPSEKFVSLGIIDGRNIWRANLAEKYSLIEKVIKRIGRERLIVSSSCSLMFIPQDVEIEDTIPEEIKTSLAFAKQKIHEIVTLTKTINEGIESTKREFEQSQSSLQKRQQSTNWVNAEKHYNKKKFLNRKSNFLKRSKIQQAILKLPLFPTTTIGSFPQTQQIRNARARYDKHEINRDEYETFLKQEVRDLIEFQEQIGLDVLVHGEFERNDMVQYFAEQLNGFIFTKYGWVQSFGSRYVRPPIIYGYVSRQSPMTVDWIRYAQGLTNKPVKGMLTGPITILKWSFVRDDQSPAETCRQIAHAVRAEVQDLQSAGIRIIQIDEPAFREGFPIRRAEVQAYLDWAVECFKIASSIAEDETQIHTHMCYSDFSSIMPAIAKMDADVISIEAARSGMKLLESFHTYKYPNAIGPGIYDIHSPRVPSESEIVNLLKNALDWIPAEHLWVNPDCGLKTRGWNEVKQALASMVCAAKTLRGSKTSPK